MRILVASDIYGATPELHALARHFPGDVAIVSPYLADEKHSERDDIGGMERRRAGGTCSKAGFGIDSRSSLSTANHAAGEVKAGTEEEAYDLFLESGGLDAYTHKLSNALAELRADALVAFSAGAAAAWRALARPDLSLGLGVLFYGSRIRDYLSLRPTVPAKLIFAEHEKAFDVAPVVASLRSQGIDAAVMPGTQHGYMNARSAGFDPRAMQASINEVIALLSRLGNDPPR